MTSAKTCPRVLVHCQYVYGIGHFVRTLELARGLASHFEVHLLNGGEVIPGFDLPESVRIIQLPAIYKKETDDGLTPVDASMSLADCFHLRENIIRQTVNDLRPDILITEHFPFGLLFRNEVTGLIEKAKRANQAARVVCSVRDIIESSQGSKNDDLTCDLLNDLYDLVLVHGDGRFAPLSASFPKIVRLHVPVVQTGYITRPIAAPSGTHALPCILASVAGGRLGQELLDSVIDNHLIIKEKVEHRLILFSGAFQRDFEKQKSRVVSLNSADVTIHGFNRSLYLRNLAEASLVISLGGYNSIIETVSANKRMLVYNRVFAGDNKEQDLRIGLFERAGFLDIITPENLFDGSLADMIVNKLSGQRPLKNDLDIKGVQTSCTNLVKLLNQ